MGLEGERTTPLCDPGEQGPGPPPAAPPSTPDCDHQDDKNNQEQLKKGQSVDITSALLDMYDTLVAQTKDDEDPLEPAQRVGNSNCNKDPKNNVLNPTGFPKIEGGPPSRSEDRKGIGNRGPNLVPYAVSNIVPNTAGRGVDRQRRPLSASSLSSSSSSSSSSLPRNGMDVKKSYLASIESLDDELSEEEIKPFKSGQLALAGNGTTSQSSATGVDVGSGINGVLGSQTGLSHIDRVLLEIVETERTYVSDLMEIIQGYLLRIPVHGRDARVTPKDFEELFGNIEDIFRFNSLFLSDMEKCGFDPVAVARTFVKHSAGFAVYTQYCTNYPRTVAVLTEVMGNHKTAEVFKERQIALHHNLPLGSYLLKPVQRILKYHLLLQNIVKHSDKDKTGYPDIKNALSVMTGIAYHINDMKRKHEHAVRVQEIQSLLYGWEGQDLTTYGELVAEGTFRMHGAKALRHIFLFDKMLVIAKKKEEAILNYKTHIMCSNLMLIESIPGEPLCFHVIPFDNPRIQYTFQARSSEQKREWCLQLKRVILENYNAVIPSHARQLVMELGQNKPEDTVSTEKSGSSRRLHSAPEYLEKRKQDRDRRKSEISLNRAFRLRKSTKKISARRTRSCSQEETNPESLLNGEENRRVSAEVPIILTQGKLTTNQTETDEGMVEPCSSKASSTSPSKAAENKTPGREKRVHPAFRAWSSLPEETTDTETEEMDRLNVRRLLQYRPVPVRSSLSAFNRGGHVIEDEYVTLTFAQSNAFGDEVLGGGSSVNDSLDNRSMAFADQGDDDDDYAEADQDANLEVLDDVRGASLPEISQTPILPRGKEKAVRNKMDNYGNLAALWAELGTVKLNDLNDEELTSDLSIVGATAAEMPEEHKETNFSWRSNSAVRRVQSFTGLAREKISSLHHSMSFRQQNGNNPSGRRGSLNRDSNLLPGNSTEGISPTTPAVWLKRQEPHMSDGCNKCGSLPRSFQLVPGDKLDALCSDSSTVDAAVSVEGLGELDKAPVCRPRMRSEGCIERPSHHNHHNQEQRPRTIASDKPMQGEFMDSLEHYINGSDSKESFRFPSQRNQPEGTTGCTNSCINSPAVSLENVHHTIHPEHKIYHHSASKYTTFKNVLTNVGSKLHLLRASVSPLGSADQTLDSCSTVSGESEAIPRSGKGNWVSDRSPSRSSLRSERDVSPRALTNKLMSSIAKAYTAMIKQRLRREEFATPKMNEGSYTPSSTRKSIHPLCKQSSGSSVIGARMARPLESEYCVPKTLLNLPPYNRKKDELRPDSVLSESSSNTTTSSEGDKTGIRREDRNSIPEILATINPLYHQINFEQEDSPSETSDGSGDSYYERTFEEIESALVEEMFRDSAIYSDPEDADLSSAEYPPITQSVYARMPASKISHEKETVFQKKTEISETFDGPYQVKINDEHQTKPTAAIQQISSLSIVESAPVPVPIPVQNVHFGGTIVEKLKCLEENAKFHKEKEINGHSTLEGIKSIRQRRLELEQCLAATKNKEEDEKNESNCESQRSVLMNVGDVEMETTESSQVDGQSAPRMRGWVKHIVHKLQSENST